MSDDLTVKFVVNELPDERVDAVFDCESKANHCCGVFTPDSSSTAIGSSFVPLAEGGVSS